MGAKGDQQATTSHNEQVSRGGEGGSSLRLGLGCSMAHHNLSMAIHMMMIIKRVPISSSSSLSAFLNFAIYFYSQDYFFVKQG
jgi:hypothetical protein